jgi:hypothetical protein
MNRHYHGTSHLGRGGIELSFPPSVHITRGEVEGLETLWTVRLNLAMFNRLPSVRIQELQKQIILLKTMKAYL